MKKVIPLSVLLLVAFLALPSCSKNASDKQATIDHQKIVDYVTTNNLQGQYTSDGMFYEILNSGSSHHPTISSTVTVNYKGYLLDGTIFDQATGSTFGLSQVIKGWQEGVPLIGTGGQILLIIPSGLAYGGSQSGSIPGNSVLAFNITLVGYTN
ncbi:MAG: FKBP-type peptidyl-prolyl cis-trans isomerase [Bacteroidales bacterium]|nr:FKBP-type peptidyl-prolyl cis-trans isomerase [Bacteroidales bacterium]